MSLLIYLTLLLAALVTAAPAPQDLTAVFGDSLTSLSADALQKGFNGQTPALNSLIHDGFHSYGRCTNDTATCSCNARQTDPTANCTEPLFSTRKSWLYELEVERLAGFHTMTVGSIQVAPSRVDAAYTATIPVTIDYLSVAYDASTCFLFNRCFSALRSTAAPLTVNNTAIIQVSLPCAVDKPYIRGVSVQGISFNAPLIVRAKLYVWEVDLYNATSLFATHAQQLLQHMFSEAKMFDGKSLAEFINLEVNKALETLPIKASFPCPRLSRS